MPTDRGLFFVALLMGCGTPQVEWPSTGVTRAYSVTATTGGWELRMDGGMVMAHLDGYHLNGQFLGPTLVADAGDALEVTLVNQTDAPIGLHPHGVHYDKDNEGMMQVADPGGEVTYHWEATNGPGTFPYHSHELDEELREYQGMAGVLGAIVLLDPAQPPPDVMVNWFLLSTYEPWTTPVDDPHGAEDTDPSTDTDEAQGGEPVVHNHTLVVQEVRSAGETWTTETKDLLTAKVALGDNVRGNVIGFGEEFHTFHTHGFTWRDPATGGPMDTRTVGPAESFWFELPEVDNPGLWMVHCHVDSHLHMMMSYLLVE